jgi:predicted nucleic acid-binding protein
MTKSMIVLDSWPVVAYLQGDGPAEQVIDIIADAHDRGDRLAMSVVNAGEVWYIVAQRHGPDEADRAISLIRSLGIEIIDVDWPASRIAASFKAGGGVSYADCFAAALVSTTATTGKYAKCTLVTGDREFKRLEKEIDIMWL